MKPAYGRCHRPGCVVAAILFLASCAADDRRESSPPNMEGIAVQQMMVPPGYSVYSNDRFGFSVAYPDSLLVPQGESQNGDGQLFASSDSSIVLVASAGIRVPGDSPASAFEERLQRRREAPGLITYSAWMDSSFVIRGASEDRIYLEKSIFYDGTVARIELTYPLSMVSVLDSVATQVSGSFGSGASRVQ